MRHSREFEQTMAQLRQKEQALRKEIEADSQKMAESGKHLLIVFSLVFVALIGGGLLRLGKRKNRGNRRGQFRWIGRLLEFFIPFIFTSLVKYRSQRNKEISDS